MNITASLLLDIVLALILVLFFVQGIRRGFILTLCSLLAVFIALAGGWYLSYRYAQPFTDYLQPRILEKLVSRAGENAAGAVDPSLAGALQAQVESAAQTAQTLFLTQQANQIASLIAHVLLFFGGFVGVLLVWTILCHALDLVTKLPGLHFVNKAMGGILGLVKGIILLLVLRWLLCDVLRVIPAQVAAGSYILSFLTTFSIPPAVKDLLPSW